MNYVPGIDVSAFDPFIVWDKVRAGGIRFAIIKVTEGTAWVNRFFTQQWNGAKSVGIVCGPYHYLRAQIDGTKQAEHFLSNVTLQDGDLPGFLDLEETFNKNASNSEFIGNTEKWLRKVEDETGRKPFVYSRGLFLRDKLTGRNGKAPDWANDYPVWIAHYFAQITDTTKPIEADGWQPWTFWQHSESGLIDGIYMDASKKTLRPVDLNVYRHSIDDLFKLAKAKPAEPITYVVKDGDTLKSIADGHDLLLEQLVEVNPKLIQKGMKLNIPVMTPTVGENEEPGEISTEGTGVITGNLEFSTYVVEEGDSLWTISQKFKTTVDDIVKLNHIPNPNLIKVGQGLKIPKARPWWNPFG
jgi:lysozyme